MSMVVGLMLNMKELADMLSVSSVGFRCPYCPCVFSCESDLDLHLKAFGDVAHRDLWRCVHIVLEADGSIAGVDNHGGWHWSYKRRSVHPSSVRNCRLIIDERGFN